MIDKHVIEYRGYNVESLGTFPMVQIKAKGQGRVPDKLLGLFTTRSEANRAIDMYLNGLVKGRKNGTKKGTSTD